MSRFRDLFPGVKPIIGMIHLPPLPGYPESKGIVTFFVVPFQFMNILMVSSIFVLRPRLSKPDSFRLPAYPLVPAIFIVVMFLFLVAALIYNPLDSLIGVALTLAGAPVYAMLARNARAGSHE